MTLDALYFTDQQDTQIQLGDIVTVTKGPYRSDKTEWVFVFCIPQHRFGFLRKQLADLLTTDNHFPEPYVTTYPHLTIYWTPKSKKEIIKLNK
jgi:hypothetical protein